MRPSRPQSRPGAPEAIFFIVFFPDAHFRPFRVPFPRSGLILETSASQKPMFSLGKTMIHTFAPFPLPARFLHRKRPKRCKKEPKYRVISICFFRVPLFCGPEAVGKRHRSLPERSQRTSGRPGGLSGCFRRPQGLIWEPPKPISHDFGVLSLATARRFCHKPHSPNLPPIAGLCSLLFT